MTDATQITYSDPSVPAPVQRTVAARLADIATLADIDLGSALSTTRRLWVPPGTYNITANTTVVADLIMDRGAVFNVASGVTLTIAGRFDAAPHPVFTGAGQVAFPQGSPTDTLHPEWWGALPDGSNASPGMTACLQAGTTGHKRVQLNGLYTMTSDAARVSGPGSLEVAGLGMSSSGLLVRNTNGGLVFSGTINNLHWDQLHVHDFQVTAMDSQRNCGDGIRASWPAVGGNVLPTLLAQSLLFQSETYASDEASHGYFTNMLHVSQANVCRIEDFNGIAIGNKTTAHVRVDNSSAPGTAVYECNISKPNMQGGKYGIYTSGEMEELLIEPLGLDGQEFCIWSDGTKGGGSGNADNGVITVRGGDLNGHSSCIQIIGWIGVYIANVNMGIYTLNDGQTSNYDVMQISGDIPSSSQIMVTDCQMGANNQSSGGAACRFFNVTRCVFANNRIDNAANGLIVQGQNNDGTQCCLVTGNQFTGDASPTGETAVFVARGDRALVVGNQITGYGTGIALAGTNGREGGNQIYGCTTAVGIGGTNNSTEAPLAAQNGFVGLPGGLTLQWGLIPGNATDHTVTFPKSFTNSCYSVTTQAIGSPPSGQVVEGIVDQVTASGFAIRPRYTQNNGAGGVANQAIYWMAIGN